MFKNRRVIIILDSYKRDSILCLKIAEELKKYSNKFNENIKVFIAQTGSDLVRVSLCCSDSIIIHNYSRINNKSTIDKLDSCGVKNVVLDTEGFPLWIFSKSGFISKELLSKIKLYFTWGKEQTFIVNKIAKKNLAIECGSFRHQRIKKKSSPNKDICLILTSSPISNPGLASQKESIKSSIKGTRLSNKDINQVVLEQKSTTERISKLIPLLANYFQKVIIRVHPFENIETYKKITKKIKNVYYSINQDLKKDLEECSTVLHGYSTAGIEAYLSGRKTYVTSRSKNLPQFLEKYFEIVSSGSETITEENVQDIFSRDAYLNRYDHKSTQKKIIDFYGVDKSPKDCLKIIRNAIFKELDQGVYFNFMSFTLRSMGSIYLQLRKFLGQAPKPNKKKSISTGNLTKIIKSENIQIKIQETNSKSCIWEIF